MYLLSHKLNILSTNSAFFFCLALASSFFSHIYIYVSQLLVCGCQLKFQIPAVFNWGFPNVPNYNDFL